MSEFYVNQKVVCVDDTPGHECDALKNGEVYTISWVGPFHFSPRAQLKHLDCSVGVRLSGVSRRYNTPYSISRFRPLESKAIQLFRSIAANPGKPIPDNAPDEIEQREIAAMWEAGGHPIW